MEETHRISPECAKIGILIIFLIFNIKSLLRTNVEIKVPFLANENEIDCPIWFALCTFYQMKGKRVLKQCFKN